MAENNTGVASTSEERVERCPKCGGTGAVTIAQVGSASGRRHFRCTTCSISWREKNPYAVALGRLGGQARVNGQTPEERATQAKTAADKRWRDARLAKNIKPNGKLA